MGTVVQQQDIRERGLPECVQDALGELVNDARQGLLALSVGVGLGVLHELLELEVDAIVGPKGKHDPERRAYRHDQEARQVTLGGRRVQVDKPRVRSLEDEEVERRALQQHYQGLAPNRKSA